MFEKVAPKTAHTHGARERETFRRLWMNVIESTTWRILCYYWVIVMKYYAHFDVRNVQKFSQLLGYFIANEYTLGETTNELTIINKHWQNWRYRVRTHTPTHAHANQHTYTRAARVNLCEQNTIAFSFARIPSIKCNKRFQNSTTSPCWIRHYLATV